MAATKQLMDYAVDEAVDAFVLLKSADVRTAKNGKQYIALVFEDRSGEISGKYWDASPEDIENYVAGIVVHLQGKRENYQTHPQIKIFHLRLTTVGEPDDPNQYIEKAPMSRADMEDYINQTVFEITQPTWNRLVRKLLAEYQEAFFTFPAAKTNHHAFQGGLAFHTISILKLAHSVVKQYPDLNAPLLFAGAILHDLGKTIELSGPKSTTYTLAGNLVGHIVLIDGELVRACEPLKLDPQAEDVLLLRHMILSHHGLLEYGSPVRPALREADVLHQLDELDASIMMLDTVVEHTAPGEFSERVFAMDGRRFYRPSEPKPKES
ncbi:HD-superfamily hydrolase [Levilactobacillus senmaizukei DSM 21775 = NBRC 103853]|uniref:HD-superfamily hydrolase n=1 Tax=Levilactobacillus senmaizukei DSM 21775 = NBRC 103853 TaxID=1423803 RepID=A0A0R2DPG6_9LACO|nr:HD domain-containing protein [Levilactobacillus senmaizukei]KRN02106.1 HD-superfamily hydrolase [Levilactobacillus senmaizukei DSM 21775 = NBRC 103853]